MGMICHNVVLYLIEFVKLIIFSFGINSQKMKNKTVLVLSASISIAFVVIVSLFFDINKVALVYGLIAIAACSSCLKYKKEFLYVATEYFAVCIVDSMLSDIYMLISGKTAAHSWVNHLQDYIINSFSIVLLLLLFAVKLKMSKVFPTVFSGKYTILLLTGMILFSMYINLMSLVTFNDAAPALDRTLTIIGGAGCIIFIAVTFLLVYQKGKTEQMQKEAGFKEQLLKSQENYYLMLLDKYEETRRFRHDIRNHFFAIRSLAEDKKYSELASYLDDMEIDISNLDTGIHSGIRIVDVIVNDCVRCYPGVHLTWDGHIPDDCGYKKKDICTVFSNLLNNAFEAADKSTEKWVRISIGLTGQALHIKISNSTDKALVYENGKAVSTKTAPGHGYGLGIVNGVIEKYNGDFNIRSISNAVEVSAVMFRKN